MIQTGDDIFRNFRKECQEAAKKAADTAEKTLIEQHNQDRERKALAKQLDAYLSYPEEERHLLDIVQEGSQIVYVKLEAMR